jgi:transposase
MAQLARGKLRAKIPQLEQALRGCFGTHQRFLIAQQLAHIDFLEETIEQLSAEFAKRMRPFGEAIERLETIPGVGRRTAEAILAEIGPEMSRFRTYRHLASWAGMCPGNDQSRGKRRSGKTTKGNPWLRAALVEAAHAAGRTKNTYLSAQYRRLASRRGKKRAAVAVGHTILVIAYHLLQRSYGYEELGGDYFDKRDRQGVERRLVWRLEGLGYKVSLDPVAA